VTFRFADGDVELVDYQDHHLREMDMVMKKPRTFR